MGLLFSQQYDTVLEEFLRWYTQYTITDEEARKVVRIYCRMREEKRE